MQGKIIKGIAGFYYVHVSGQGVYECKAKGIFRKEHVKPLVGDDVELEVLNDQEMLGNIHTNFTPEKCSPSAGSSQCGPGIDIVCHCEAGS